MKVQNKRWTDEEFFTEREKVLKQWPTGAVSYTHLTLPTNREV